MIENNLHARVPGQRRVAMAGGNVPDFDGAVPTAAGDKLVVRRKSNGVDPVIETSVIFLLCSLKNDEHMCEWPVNFGGK